MELKVFLFLVLIELAIIETAAVPIIVSEEICANPHSTLTLTCKGSFGSKTEKILHWYRKDNGPQQWELIEPDSNPSKYRVAINHTRELDGTWYKKLDLEVSQVTTSDAGVYGCGTQEQDIKETNVTVPENADLTLSTSQETLKLGQNLSVEAAADCPLDGTVRVEKSDQNGARTAVPYGPQDPDVEPYVRANDGALIIPKFRCEDVGHYEFTYTTRDGLLPNDSKKTVFLKGESCTMVTGIPIQPSNSPVVSNQGETVNVAVPVLAIICVLLVIVCGFLVYDRRRRGNAQRGPGAGSEESQLALSKDNN